jgi:hypothetical protein
MGYAHMGTQTNAIFTKHLIVISLSLLTMVGFYFVPAKFLYKIAPFAYTFCWFFTLVVYFFGADTTNGWTAPATFPVTISADGDTITIGASSPVEQFGNGIYRPAVFRNNDYWAIATSDIVLKRVK